MSYRSDAIGSVPFWSSYADGRGRYDLSDLETRRDIADVGKDVVFGNRLDALGNAVVNANLQNGICNLGDKVERGNGAVLTALARQTADLQAMEIQRLNTALVMKGQELIISEGKVTKATCAIPLGTCGGVVPSA